MICPKCGYARKPTDTNPDWQCPSCGIAYAKFRQGPPRTALAPRLAAGGRELAAHAQSDGTLAALVLSNLLALVIGFLAGMSLREMMAVYWLQSVIIGVCSAVRILSLERFEVGNLEINGKPAIEAPATKWGVGGFFLLHYGVFHLVYLGFLIAEPGPIVSSRMGFFLCGTVFAVNHVYSLFRNIRLDAHGKPDIGTLMFLPYARILPMHLTILAGGTVVAAGTASFMLFGGLKLLADALMHTVEHHVLGKGRVLPPKTSLMLKLP